MLGQLSQLIPIGGAIQDIAAALIQERDREKLASIKIDLTDKILDLQAKLLEVHNAVALESEAFRHAQDRIRELESHHREKARYELAKLGTVGDFFAYRLRPAGELDERQTEPAHFICQPCFDARKQKSILRIQGWQCCCSICNTKVQINSSPERPTTRGEPDPLAIRW